MNSKLIITVATVLTLIISSFSIGTPSKIQLEGEPKDFIELATYAQFDEVNNASYATDAEGISTVYIKGTIDGVNAETQFDAKLFDSSLRCPCNCQESNPKYKKECVRFFNMSACLPCSESPFLPGN